jgi:hypothetical protein
MQAMLQESIANLMRQIRYVNDGVKCPTPASQWICGSRARQQDFTPDTFAPFARLSPSSSKRPEPK